MINEYNYKVKLGYNTFKLLVQDEKVMYNEEHKKVNGYIDADMGEIVIGTKEWTCRDEILQTVIHECIHGITYDRNISNILVERDIEFLGNMLYSVIKDNDHIFKLMFDLHLLRKNFMYMEGETPSEFEKKHIKIGYKDYLIQIIDKVIDEEGNNNTCCIKHSEGIIQLRKNPNKYNLLVYLWQSILYGICEFGVYTFNNEENMNNAIVTDIALGLTNFIVDNPKLIAFNENILF